MDTPHRVTSPEVPYLHLVLSAGEKRAAPFVSVWQTAFSARFRELLEQEEGRPLSLLELYSLYADGLRRILFEAKGKKELLSSSAKEVLTNADGAKAVEHSLRESASKEVENLSEAIPDSLLFLLMSLSRWFSGRSEVEGGELVFRSRMKLLARRFGYEAVFREYLNQMDQEDAPTGEGAGGDEEVDAVESAGKKMKTIDRQRLAFGAYTEARRMGRQPTEGEITALVQTLREVAEVDARPEMSLEALDRLVLAHQKMFDLAAHQQTLEVQKSALGGEGDLLNFFLPPEFLKELQKVGDEMEGGPEKTSIEEFLETVELIRSDEFEGEDPEALDHVKSMFFFNFVKTLALRFKTLFLNKVIRRQKLRTAPFFFESNFHATLNNFLRVRSHPLFSLWKSMLLARALELQKTPGPARLTLIEEKKQEADSILTGLSSKLYEPPHSMNFYKLGVGPLQKATDKPFAVEEIYIEPGLTVDEGPIQIDQLGKITLVFSLKKASGTGEGRVMLPLVLGRFDGDVYLYDTEISLKEVMAAYGVEADYQFLRVHIIKGLRQALSNGYLKEVDPLRRVSSGDAGAKAIQEKLGVPTYTGDDYEATFQKSWAALAKAQPGLVRRAYDVIETYKTTPTHPSLRTHTLSGQMADVVSISINMAYRIIFKKGEGGKLTFLDIGTHEVYRT